MSYTFKTLVAVPRSLCYVHFFVLIIKKNLKNILWRQRCITSVYSKTKKQLFNSRKKKSHFLYKYSILLRNCDRKIVSQIVCSCSLTKKLNKTISSIKEGSYKNLFIFKIILFNILNTILYKF